MKKVLTTVMLCTALAFGAIAEEVPTPYIAKSKAVVKEFFGQLKGELTSAMKSGGPVNAISVCNTSAPAIAQSLSTKHGVEVGRTSLKPRNPNNAPDDWERQVLQNFEKRRAAGESPANMSQYEIIDTADGKKQFRFMKAIGMPPLSKMPCLKCHGENIAPDIAAKLDALYPQDMARNYKAGDIRGAFTLTMPME